MSLRQIKASLCDMWGGDRDSANAAWASTFDKSLAEAKTDEDVRRVITGVVKLHHDTPKERVWLEVFITCPIFVERQFDKYRMTVQAQDFQVEYWHAPFGRDGITQNELSGRYRTIPDRAYGTPIDVLRIMNKTLNVKGVRAGEPVMARLEFENMLRIQREFYERWLISMKDAERDGTITNAEYKRAREVLRGVLGTAYLTDMRITMNMNAFEHIINQRLAPEAQLESRVVAYHLVNAVAESQRLPVMLPAMIEANGWENWMQEVEKALEE